MKLFSLSPSELLRDGNNTCMFDLSCVCTNTCKFCNSSVCARVRACVCVPGVCSGSRVAVAFLHAGSGVVLWERLSALVSVFCCFCSKQGTQSVTHIIYKIWGIKIFIWAHAVVSAALFHQTESLTVSTRLSELLMEWSVFQIKLRLSPLSVDFSPAYCCWTKGIISCHETTRALLIFRYFTSKYLCLCVIRRMNFSFWFFFTKCCLFGSRSQHR